VFRAIQKQTGYYFIYTKEDLRDARPVSLQVKDAALENVLSICFKEQPLDYTIEENQIVVMRKKESKLITDVKPLVNTIDVKGSVVGTSGEPMEAISVVVKGGSGGTSTDANGMFQLKEIDANAVLVFSGVNVETLELPLHGRTYVEVVLKSRVTSLGTVSVEVNTGYQRLPRERATGSFTTVNNSEFNQQVTTDVLSRLEAVAAGVSFGRKSNTSIGQMHVRGLSTINGPQSPLIVVDDFPYEGDPANLNPNDVESITILKDAAAASIWGARAANGVVVITTKKAHFNQPFSVEFNTSVKLVTKPDLNYLPTISSSDFIDAEQFLFNKGFRFADTADITRPPFSPVYEILFKQRSGEISSQQASAQINSLRDADIKNDYSRYFYKQNVSQQYALNLKGGSDNITWLMSAGYDRDLNEVSAGYDRITVRYENKVKLSKKLELGSSASFVQATSKSGRPRYGEVYAKTGGLPPYVSFAGSDGSPVAVIKDYRQPFLDTAGAGKLPDWNYYPLEDYKHSTEKKSIQNLLAKLSSRYSVSKSLVLELNYQYESQQSTSKTLNDEESYYARNLVNLFTQMDRSTGQVNRMIPAGGILDLSNQNTYAHNLRGQANYNLSQGKHQVSAIAGAEVRQVKSDQNFFRTYGYNDDLLTSANVDYTNPYTTFIPFYAFSSTAFIPDNKGLSSRLNRFISFFGNGAYTYNKKYTVSLSARKDASNIFGVSTNHKWNPLWSAGASWEISKEGFYTTSLLPYLRLRFSYGYNGNLNPSLSALTTISYTGTSPYTGAPIAKVDKFYNPDLRWEKNGQLNLGLDFQLVHQRVTGSIDYFRKKGNGLYGPSLLDYTVGLSTVSITKNVASMKGKGWELQLQTVNLDGALKWTTQWNLNTYHDEITSYYLRSFQGLNFMGTNISGVKGTPVYSVYSYPWAGLDPLTGEPRGYYKGAISKNYATLLFDSIQNLRYNGPAMPSFYGTLGNTVSWKGLSLTAALVFKMGHYFKRPSIEYTNLFQYMNGHSDFAFRWKKSGDENFTNVPAMIYPANDLEDAFYRNSEVLVEKADNIRLQYLTLSYTLPRKLLHGAHRYLQVYLNANDPGILWRANKEGIDPEYLNGIVPTPKSYVFGVRATF
jgi:TonB-linked SusC/RagA family outer membrane protein